VVAAVGKRKAKTRKGRRILERRRPQIVEDAKTALILRGNKCSSDTQALLRDLYRLRSPLATLFMRSHPEHPFEDIKRVESLCVKYDHSLFAFGSSSKKRPFRLILGRLFDGSLLDMQEFNVEDYKSIDSFNKSVKESVAGSKPLIAFQGAAFESDERLKRAKSLLLDFFRGPAPEKVLLQGLEQVMVCSTFDSSASGGGGGGASSSTPAAAAAAAGAAPAIFVRRFRIDMLKSGSRLPRVELQELGPRLKLTLDRVKEPDRDRWKGAIKVPKAAKEQKVKNIKGDSMGKKRGRIHLGKQDFNQIHTVHHSKAKSKKLKADLKADSVGGSGPAGAGKEA